MSMVVDAPEEIVVEPMPTLVDLATWDAVVSLREDAYELVEGVPTMTPSESNFNRVAGAALAVLLHDPQRRWVVGTDMDVTLRDGRRPTVRRPDVVVASRASVQRDRAPLPESRLLVGEPLLVAEIVSASSVERDLVTKRREYALAGIPAYLVVDLRFEPGQMTLYVERGEDGLYVDVPPADSVTVQINGVGIPIAVADLIP